MATRADRVGRMPEVSALLVAVAAYVLANLLLVACACFLQGRGFITIFAGPAACAGVSALTSLLLGLGLVTMMDSFGAPGLLLGALATGPLASFARAQRQKVVA